MFARGVMRSLGYGPRQRDTGQLPALSIGHRSEDGRVAVEARTRHPSIILPNLTPCPRKGAVASSGVNLAYN
jgi:hypothetical protein